jgi:antitoxin ParD1/3/4
MEFQKFSITLPLEMGRVIDARVSSGGYGSASEVIREALRVWVQREKRLEALDAAIVAGLEGGAIPAEEVRRILAERFKG